MSFRRERKFRLTASDSRVLRADLLANGMLNLYPDRHISSQYFDTRGLQSFEDSEEGVLPRHKVRVRWYNDDKQILTLERKFSSIEGRFKTVSGISPESYEEYLTLGYPDQDYGLMFPSVQISYDRSYFSHRGLRFTFDRNIIFSFPEKLETFRDFEEVLEVKFSTDTGEDFLDSIISIPTSRFSKYGRSFLRQRGLI